VRILIVDDQKLFAESLKKVLLAEDASVTSVSLALNGEEALQKLREDLPDVVLMDIHMPVMDGIEATRLIHRKYPSVKILMLTTFGYDEYVKAAIDKGAVGYLLKDISSTELLASIRAAQSGVRIISPQVLEGIAGTPRRTVERQAAPPWLRELTGRERDILSLVVRGFSNEEIAEKIFLSLQTVKNYLSSIYAKMGVENRFRAMRLAMEHKIDRFPPEDGPAT
jgi:DNA-binding NarL/FixJ family response regulator